MEKMNDKIMIDGNEYDHDGNLIIESFNDEMEKIDDMEFGYHHLMISWIDEYFDPDHPLSKFNDDLIPFSKINDDRSEMISILNDHKKLEIIKFINDRIRIKLINRIFHHEFIDEFRKLNIDNENDHPLIDNIDLLMDKIIKFWNGWINEKK
jgi:hypothetical protein